MTSTQTEMDWEVELEDIRNLYPELGALINRVIYFVNNDKSHSYTQGREDERKWVLENVIGKDDILREKRDMLPAQYHRAKGRNELRQQQRTHMKEEV